MIRAASLVLVFATIGTVSAQDALKPKSAQQIFSDARDLMNAGSLEVAADVLKDYLAANPGPQDYLDIEAKYGPTTFLKLRTVPRWYDDPKRNTEFKEQVVEKIVAASITANESLLKNPKRIARFISNLKGAPEEYAFAVAELKRSGDAVVPQLIESLRLDDADQRAGVLKAITELGPETVPGILAAAEGITDEFKLMILGALARRPDFLPLTVNTDSNTIPYLWYLSGLPKNEPNALRDFAVSKLKQLYAAAFERRTAEDELTRAARPLYERKAKFAANDSANSKVKVWKWDTAASTVKPVDLSKAAAEEDFGLKYLRWALERNAAYEPASDLFLAFATSRAVERAKFADLSSADPNAFKLIAFAPTTTLIRILDAGIAENNTALVLGMVQGLGDKADPLAGTAEMKPGGTPRQPVLVKALDYPDPRVQVSAALALLKIPNAKHGAHGRIVDVLKRAIAPDASSGTGAGKALVADPSSVRGDQVAGLLRAIGYQVEVLGNGRQLAQRIDRRGDFDLVLIDRHIAQPTLVDLIPQLRGDANTARRPLMIVASPDTRGQLGLETILTRLAALIAATETEAIEVPGIPAINRNKAIDEIERERKALVELRDRRLGQLYALRLARLTRLLEASNIKQSDALKRRLDMRLPQLTMAALIAEFDLTDTSAPKMERDFKQLTGLIQRQTDLDASVKNVDVTTLVNLLQQLETVLTPEARKQFDIIRARMDEESLALPRDVGIDRATEASLQRIAQAYPGVSVIREPYSRVGFEEDVNAAMPDAAQRPRDPNEKVATSNAALAALLKLADGTIAGYDVKPATGALRNALANDAMAPTAAMALARIGSASAQTDLVRLAADAGRKPEIRSVAIEAAIWNIQAFGKQTAKEVVENSAKATATEPQLQSDLAVLNTILSGKPAEYTESLKAYRPTTPAPPKAKEPAPMPEEKKEDKKENQ